MPCLLYRLLLYASHSKLTYQTNSKSIWYTNERTERVSGNVFSLGRPTESRRAKENENFQHILMIVYRIHNLKTTNKQKNKNRLSAVPFIICRFLQLECHGEERSRDAFCLLIRNVLLTGSSLNGKQRVTDGTHSENLNI